MCHDAAMAKIDLNCGEVESKGTILTLVFEKPLRSESIQ